MVNSSPTTYNSCRRTGTPYVRTSTSIPTGEAVNVTYGSGYFAGLECKDLATFFSVHDY